MTISGYSGRTTRSFLRKTSNGILNGNIPHCPRYSTITRKKIRSEIQNIAFNLLNALSGGDPISLLSNTLSRDDKIQLEPLNTVMFLYAKCPKYLLNLDL